MRKIALHRRETATSLNVRRLVPSLPISLDEEATDLDEDLGGEGVDEGSGGERSGEDGGHGLKVENEEEKEEEGGKTRSAQIPSFDVTLKPKI